MVVANAVAGLAEISQTCGRDLLDLDKGNIPKLLAALNECALDITGPCLVLGAYFFTF